MRLECLCAIKSSSLEVTHRSNPNVAGAVGASNQPAGFNQAVLFFRQSLLRLRQRASPSVTTRITIDSAWSAIQMQNCLVLFFSRWFVKPAGQKWFFTFLQVSEASFHPITFLPQMRGDTCAGF